MRVNVSLKQTVFKDGQTDENGRMDGHRHTNTHMFIFSILYCIIDRLVTQIFRAI